MPSIELLSVALDYHKRGWNVLPVEGKRPVISGWKKWQTVKMDVGDINRMESYWRTATGIAVVCGPVSGNLVVIDLDGQQAIDLFYSQFPRLTKTHTVKTGNGLHLYYHQHHHFITDKAVHKVVIGDGEIAVRVENCYVVAPPSLHPSGVRYQVQDGWKIKRTALLGRVLMWMEQQKAPVPSVETDVSEQLPGKTGDKTSLMQSVEEEQSHVPAAPDGNKTPLTETERHQQWAQAALDGELEKLRAATKGERNDRLYHAALKLGSIIAGGYLKIWDVESELMEAAENCGLIADDGTAQCLNTMRSGVDAGMQNPRHPADKSEEIAKHNGDLSRAPDTEEDNHPLPKNPDAEELAQYIRSQMELQYTFFRESWQVYEDGIWKPIKNLNRGITNIIKSVRHRQVKANPSTVNNVSFFLQTYMELMDESVIDDYPHHIACNNGMFNLEKLTLEDHSPRHYITGKTAWDYDPKATCPVFLKWLSSMLTYPDGTPDKLMLEFVQEAFGYSLTTDTRYRMSFWLKGPKHSGKSTLLEVLSEMLNIYHGVLNLNELERNRFMLAMTYGKRVVTCAETEKGVKIPDGQYKMLVDNASRVVADVKYGDPIVFKPTAKIWWAMNNFPRIADNTGAVHSRVTVIPYHRSISIDERDLDLLDKIRCELSGVFNWALEGLQRLNTHKRFTTVPQSEVLKEELEVKDSIYRQFLDDPQWCKKGEVTLSRHLNDAFVAWCHIQGIRNTGSSDMRRKPEFVDAGLQYDRTSGISKFYGIELTEHAIKQISFNSF